MFRNVFTLLRGGAHRADERFADQTALLLLDQQLRDATAAVTAARKAVAVAIAQQQQEAQQRRALISRIEDLEHRAIEALKQDKEDLAQEAAETLALLEDERQACDVAEGQFKTEIARLKANVAAAETKLRALKRGQRLATATDQAQRLRAQVPSNGPTALAQAEATLERLRQRQTEMDLTAAAMESLDETGSPERLAEKLAQAGCGAPLKSRADDILTKLKQQL